MTSAGRHSAANHDQMSGCIGIELGLFIIQLDPCPPGEILSEGYTAWYN